MTPGAIHMALILEIARAGATPYASALAWLRGIGLDNDTSQSIVRRAIERGWLTLSGEYLRATWKGL